MPSRTLDRINKRLRHIDRAITVPSAELMPTDETEFGFLLTLNGITNEDEREELKRLWLAGFFVLWLAWSEQLASKTNVLTYDTVAQQMRRATEGNASYHRYLAEQLRLGNITLDEFEREMQVSITDASEAMMVAVFGPGWRMMPEVAAIYNDYLTRELNWLKAFVAGLAAGFIAFDGNVARRAAMYGFSAYALLTGLQALWASHAGYTHEENILGIAEHCDGCLAETARGIVPIGSLAPIGTRTCLSNCRCSIRYYRYNPVTGEYEG